METQSQTTIHRVLRNVSLSIARNHMGYLPRHYLRAFIAKARTNCPYMLVSILSIPSCFRSSPQSEPRHARLHLLTHMLHKCNTSSIIRMGMINGSDWLHVSFYRLLSPLVSFSSGLQSNPFEVNALGSKRPS